MNEHYIHTRTFAENEKGGLMICGINHGKGGGDHTPPGDASFFSDRCAQDNRYRNTIVRWFALWGWIMRQDEATARACERSIVQLNWLDYETKDVSHMNVREECIRNGDSFLQQLGKWAPRLVMFYGRGPFDAFTSPQLSSRVERIFGAKQAPLIVLGEIPRKPKLRLQRFEEGVAVGVPHPQARRMSSDYVASFSFQLRPVIGEWWRCHIQDIADCSPGNGPYE